MQAVRYLSAEYAFIETNNVDHERKINDVSYNAKDLDRLGRIQSVGIIDEHRKAERRAVGLHFAKFIRNLSFEFRHPAYLEVQKFSEPSRTLEAHRR